MVLNYLCTWYIIITHLYIWCNIIVDNWLRKTMRFFSTILFGCLWSVHFSTWTLGFWAIKYTADRTLTFRQGHSGIISVYSVQYSLIANLSFRDQTDLTADVRSTAAHDLNFRWFKGTRTQAQSVHSNICSSAAMITLLKTESRASSACFKMMTHPAHDLTRRTCPAFPLNLCYISYTFTNCPYSICNLYNGYLINSEFSPYKKINKIK